MNPINENIFLLLGSNMGSGLKLFLQAIKTLAEQLGEPICKSAIYTSPPWGFDASQDFINQLVVFDSSMEDKKILEICLETEERLGRKRNLNSQTYESRTIDIDILYIGNRIIATPLLEVPHPKMHLRRFALLPLADNFPDMQHPGLHKSQIELLHMCPDKSEVKKLS